jgi:hypothetical protein
VYGVQVTSGSGDDVIEKLCEYYSDYSKLQRAVAWLLRLKDMLRGKDTCLPGVLQMDELRRAELEIVTKVQMGHIRAEYRCLERNGAVPLSSLLYSLKPVLDADGVMREGGRLANATVSDDTKHPMIIPKKRRLGYLLSGAAVEIREALAELDQAKMSNKMLELIFQWLFQPTNAPHFERMIGVAKKVMLFQMVMSGMCTIDDEGRHTLCCIVEGIVNSRPPGTASGGCLLVEMAPRVFAFTTTSIQMEQQGAKCQGGRHNNTQGECAKICLATRPSNASAS